MLPPSPPPPEPPALPPTIPAPLPPPVGDEPFTHPLLTTPPYNLCASSSYHRLILLTYIVGSMVYFPSSTLGVALAFFLMVLLASSGRARPLRLFMAPISYLILCAAIAVWASAAEANALSCDQRVILICGSGAAFVCLAAMCYYKRHVQFVGIGLCAGAALGQTIFVFDLTPSIGPLSYEVPFALALALIMIFPQIALWLPEYIYGN